MSIKTQIHVEAVNAANDYANKLRDQLIPQFEPLVGKKILKVGGMLLEKYADIGKGLPYTPSLHVYKNSNDYALSWNVKVCKTAPHENTHRSNYCCYHETTVYIGELNGHILEKVCPQPNYRTDYTLEEVLANREAYKAAEKAMRDAQAKLHPFGEYD